MSIFVDDAGPGIEAGIRERLFEPFHAASDGRTDGAGLGLAIAREQALALGATSPSTPPRSTAPGSSSPFP